MILQPGSSLQTGEPSQQTICTMFWAVALLETLLRSFSGHLALDGLIFIVSAHVCIRHANDLSFSYYW
jgi:hypothetical protein